jgi:signal transduction histidine kinase
VASVNPDDRQATSRETAKLSRGAETIRFENRYACKDGSYRWLEWNARSSVDRSEIYATARDITDRKRLEREILEVLDREKERRGRDLHDGLAARPSSTFSASPSISRS